MRCFNQALVALLILAAGTFHSGVAQAQPSAARIRKDTTGPGVISFKLSGRGGRVWSSAYSQYVWDQAVVITRKANIKEYPNATIEVGGIASYGWGGGYPYRGFYVTYNSYTGIPAPSAAEIVGMIQKDLPTFLGYRYNTIVGDVGGIGLAKVPNWNWHSPNSVSFNVDASFSEKINNTMLEKKKATYEVRLYRDAIKQPWKSFFSSPKTDVSLGKSTHAAEDLAAMKTLNIVDGERRAMNRLKELPAVEIPAFKSDLEMFAFLHNSLREGNPLKTESILRRSLVPMYFENNSDVLLNGAGEELVQTVLKSAFKGKSKYAEQYGSDLNVKDFYSSQLEFWNADGKHFSRMAVKPSGGTWQNGVKVGQEFKISALEIWLATDADEIARLRSIPAETRFGPINGSKPFSSLGAQVATEQKIEKQVAEVKAIPWTPFTSTKAQMRLSLPSVPTETEGKMNGKYPMWTLTAKHQQVQVVAVSTTYPTILNRKQAQIVVESTLDQLSKSNNLTIKSMGEVNEGTYGRLGVLQSNDTLMKARVFVLGDTLYQLILSSSPENMGTINENEFFSSFSRVR